MSRFQPRVGYCTNVHAGTDLRTIRETLATHAAAIAQDRRRKRPDAGPLPVGLWIPASAADELIAPGAAEAFGGWLAEHDLTPLTINGFPYDNFHLPVVKHRVYRPAWWESQRLHYTRQLAELLTRLLAEDEPGRIGSISTLPLGWPGPLGRGDVAVSGVAADSDAELEAAHVARAGANLRELASDLQRLEQRSGRRIVVAIEPEPGCLLDRCEDVIRFFERELPAAHHRRYLGVCHDVCHSAVMFEPQAAALTAYARAGLIVGKVQISCAIDLPLQDYAPEDRAAAIAELRGFAEDRYLHQTGVLDSAGRFRLIEDLPQWLADQAQDGRSAVGAGSDAGPVTAGETPRDSHLRTHFHVPIFRRGLGHLRSTQDAILGCVRALHGVDAPEFTGHYEVETYAWSVLPEGLKETSLAAGIAHELEWFESRLSECRGEEPGSPAGFTS